MLNRREFLKRSSLVALAPTIPGFLSRAAKAIEPSKDDRVLVVIQLDGGNDGINTVVPFADPGYAEHRKQLKLPENRLRKLNDELALHSSMEGAAKLFEQQRLAIVQGVGYPNPNRSHDVSMGIWQSARLDPEEHAGYGWIGRSFDASADATQNSPMTYVGEGSIPAALRARKAGAAAFSSLDDLRLPDGIEKVAAAQSGKRTELDDFVERRLLEAYDTANQIGAIAVSNSATTYPTSSLAKSLKTISSLVKSGMSTRVYYAVQSGYDTHSDQLQEHSNLLRDFSQALAAFQADLVESKLDDRVLTLCFSEFGRRVAENASAGTDHGTAGPVLLCGTPVAGGIHGTTPRLQDLEDGDLKFTTDFRSVYATVLERWLNVPSQTVLGDSFAQLELLQVRG